MTCVTGNPKCKHILISMAFDIYSFRYMEPRDIILWQRRTFRYLEPRDIICAISKAVNMESRYQNVFTFWITLYTRHMGIFSTWRLNFSRTEICTAKPMVAGCVEHYSTHVSKKSLEPFFHKVQKTGQKCRF